MQTLCITGLSEQDLLQVKTRFQKAGMATAKSSAQGNLGMDQWHDHFFKPNEGNIDNQVLPGKFGEQMAGEIFMANLQLPFWGWQDRRSVWCLEFWAEFDPRLLFLLVCTPLEFHLARSIENISGRPIDVDKIARQWCDTHELLLRFYHHLSDRCLLMDVRDCSGQFKALANHCNETWHLSLSPEFEGAEKSFIFPSPLACHLAKDFLDNQAEAKNLWNEINATMKQFSSHDQALQLPLADIAASFHILQDRSHEHRQIAEMKTRVDTLENDLAQKAGRLDSLGKQRQETQEENEQLLLQLHQVQEELESTFLQNKDIEKQWNENREKLQSELTAKDQQISNLNTNIENLKGQIQDKDKTRASLEKQRQEIQEENELLLLQLHQVQEELEHYFLKYQDLNTEQEKMKTRWARLHERIPDYHDYESLKITQIQGSRDLAWEITGLEIGSREFQNLQFETFILGGICGFRFTRPEEVQEDSGTAPLLRWPGEISDDPSIELIPVAETQEDVTRRVNALKGLAAGDWTLLPVLAKFLNTCLKEKSKENSELPRAVILETQTGLDRLIELMEKFPPALRFDQVNVSQHTLSEDCEMLEISFKNLDYGEFQCPEFGFRLSCAGLESEGFGSHPRLEFLPTTETVLESWFDNSNTPEDPRLEIRFALPDAMDMDVWKELSENDAGFIRMLVQELSLVLNRNSVKEKEFKHPIEQWLSVIRDVQDILNLHTTDQEEVA